MRKLYPLVAGLFLFLAAMKTNGQQKLTPSAFTENYFVNKSVYFSNEVGYNGLYENEKIEVAETTVDCQADFETNFTPNSPLLKKFSAIPQNSEQKRPVYICWKFGDGKDTCIQYSNTYSGPYPVVHAYQTPGVYEVCVRIVYEGGCEATKCRQITVEKPDECKVDFERIPFSSTSYPLLVYYKTLPWHNNGKKPKQICWKFGDGKDTCIEYPENYTELYPVSHTYREPGNYEVCVKIIYQGGCETYKCKSILVSRTDECGADFERLPLTPGTSPLAIGFKALPTLTNTRIPKLICWTFGDGKDTCIEYAQNFYGPYGVNHKYAVAGNYEVCVKIIYYGGCEAKKCKQITIERPDECKANFERLTVDGTNSQQLAYFKALPGHSNNKKPKQICWKFGDGKDTCINYSETFAGTYAVKHEYREPGNYEVCVKILYYGGCEAKLCKFIQIGRPDECKADFEKLTQTISTTPLGVYYRAFTGHNNNKKPKQICWKFGDGKDTCINYSETFTGTYAVKHEYREHGNYEVCVKIIYYGGCEAKACKLIQVGTRPDECKADFEKLPISTSNNPLVAYYKAFTAHNNNKKPKQICWKFGDGKDTCITYPENYTGEYAVRHEYREAGNFEVCVIILYYGGCEARNCKLIQLGRPDECKADFEKLAQTASNIPLGVYYKAITGHNNNKKPKQICWYFGDGKDTCITYPENFTGTYAVHHGYRQAGKYEVCIKILYYGGCEAKKCNVVSIEGPGECRVKLFEISPSITSLVRGFTIAPWSSNNKKPLTICLNFGDGRDTCIQLNPSEPLPTEFTIRHTYPGPGVYRACVKVLFDGGCFAYECIEVVIRSGTNTCGGYMTDSLVSPRTVKFKGFGVNNQTDAVIAYYWTFGDGSGGAGKEVTHTYNAPGSYEVCLQINTQSGCVTKICKKLIVPGDTRPVLHLSPNPVENTLHVLFYSTHTESVNIKIVNTNGVIVKSYVRNVVIGANNWDVDVATLAPGTYTLYIQSANQLSSQLFIKN